MCPASSYSSSIDTKPSYVSIQLSRIAPCISSPCITYQFGWEAVHHVSIYACNFQESSGVGERILQVETSHTSSLLRSPPLSALRWPAWQWILRRLHREPPPPAAPSRLTAPPTRPPGALPAGHMLSFMRQHPLPRACRRPHASPVVWHPLLWLQSHGCLQAALLRCALSLVASATIVLSRVASARSIVMAPAGDGQDGKVLQQVAQRTGR